MLVIEEENTGTGEHQYIRNIDTGEISMYGYANLREHVNDGYELIIGELPDDYKMEAGKQNASGQLLLKALEHATEDSTTERQIIFETALAGFRALMSSGRNNIEFLSKGKLQEAMVELGKSSVSKDPEANKIITKAIHEFMTRKDLIWND